MSDEEARGSRKRAPAPIGDAVAAWLGRTGIGARVAQATIIVDWPRLGGRTDRRSDGGGVDHARRVAARARGDGGLGQ